MSQNMSIKAKKIKKSRSASKFILKLFFLIFVGINLSFWLKEIEDIQIVSDSSFANPNTECTVTPIPYEYALRNPMKGFTTRGTNSHPWATLAHTYIRWNELENDESDEIDKIIDFCNKKWEGLAEKNVKVIPRVYLHWSGDKKYWPADMQEDDYSSEQFEERFLRLIKRLGQCWDNDSRVAFIEMGIFGKWGEQHSPYPTAEMEKLATDAFAKAFKNKKVSVRRNWERFTEHPFGEYWDSWAHYNQMWQHGNNIKKMNNKGRYLENYIGGEVAYDWGDSDIQPGPSPTASVALEKHRNFIINTVRWLHCTQFRWISDYDRTNNEANMGAEEIQKALGYRYELDEVRFSLNDSLNISFDVSNAGSAPFYYNWPVEVALLDKSSNEPVWKSTIKNADIREWLPGEKWTDPNWTAVSNYYEYASNWNENGMGEWENPPQKNTIEGSFKVNVPDGEYVLSLAILDPAGDLPSIRLATQNYLKGGRHPLGTVNTGSSQCSPLPEDFHFDNPSLDNSLYYNVESKAIVKNGDKPNVLFISIDDLNDWVGCIGGNPQVKTPNLDKLNASGGMIMYKAHAPATVCCPSRSALLTGVHAHKTGVYGNKNNLKYAPKAKDVATLPEYFRDNGYVSLSMGKIFHKHPLPGDAPGKNSDVGQWAFDEYYKTLGGVGPISTECPVNGLPNLEDENLNSYHATAFDWGPTKGNDETQMLDYLTANWASEQLSTRDFEKPFFMAVGISKPHLSWYVPQKYFDMYPLEEIVIPETIPGDLEDILDNKGNQAYKPHDTWRRIDKYNRHKEAVRAYLATITFVDDCIGVLLDGLANSKYADNTIVMLWGDHGWHLGEKQKYGKTQLWQESCRVPMMVKVPGVTPENKKCMGVVNLIDMYPTLVELCDLPENPKNDGRSFAELLHNPDMEWNFPTLTTNTYKEHRIFDGRYSYINHLQRGIEQLYDHQTDSMEFYNLINNPDYADIKARLKSYLPESNEAKSPENGNWPEPEDTIKRVWVFPGDTLPAWQYDYYGSNSGEILFSTDSAQTIGIYRCNDTGGVNIREYEDAEQYKDAAQFQWNNSSETFEKNGQWLNFTAKFTNEEPYQLLLRARKNIDANFRLSLCNTQGDTVFFKDVNLNNDFNFLQDENENTAWFLSNFPIQDVWGDYVFRFDWYDNIGEPGIFGAFSFIESDLDLTAPEWYYVSIGTITKGTDIVVMTTEDATVYMVPKGTPSDTNSILEAAVSATKVSAYSQGFLSTTVLVDSVYVLYAIDNSNNISEVSRSITIQTPVNSKDPTKQSEPEIFYNYNSRIVQVVSNNELSHIEVYNILGKRISSKKHMGKTTSFSTRDFTPGVYVIRVLEENGTAETKKIHIQ